MPDLPWPFIGTEVLSSGAIAERAMRKHFEQLYPGVFVPRGSEPNARQRAEAAWLWSGRRGTVAGSSAAAMLGTKWIDGSRPAELIHDNPRPPARLVVRNESLGVGEWTDVDGVRTTSAARTGFDIGRHTVSRVQAVQRLDALTSATGVSAGAIEAIATAHAGVRGLNRLRGVLPLVDAGAESPQETVARLALVDAGLPAPQTQFRVLGRYGEFLARLDMAYGDVKVGIEYDGPQHWTDPAVRQRDIDKQFELTALGWFIIRVSRDLLKYRRPTYARRVENALLDRGFVLPPRLNQTTEKRRRAS
jgi:hypothetical protein